MNTQEVRKTSLSLSVSRSSLHRRRHLSLPLCFVIVPGAFVPVHRPDHEALAPGLFRARVERSETVHCSRTLGIFPGLIIFLNISDALRILIRKKEDAWVRFFFLSPSCLFLSLFFILPSPFFLALNFQFLSIYPNHLHLSFSSSSYFSLSRYSSSFFSLSLPLFSPFPPYPLSSYFCLAFPFSFSLAFPPRG